MPPPPIPPLPPLTTSPPSQQTVESSHPPPQHLSPTGEDSAPQDIDGAAEAWRLQAEAELMARMAKDRLQEGALATPKQRESSRIAVAAATPVRHRLNSYRPNCWLWMRGHCAGPGRCPQMHVKGWEQLGPWMKALPR
eukprot:gene3042-4291_t